MTYLSILQSTFILIFGQSYISLITLGLRLQFHFLIGRLFNEAFTPDKKVSMGEDVFE